MQPVLEMPDVKPADSGRPSGYRGSYVDLAVGFITSTGAAIGGCIFQCVECVQLTRRLGVCFTSGTFLNELSLLGAGFQNSCPSDVFLFVFAVCHKVCVR